MKTTKQSASGKSDALATKETNTAVAVKTTAQETFAPLEGFEANDSRGKEGIETSDLRLPFLALAQKTTKAIDETDDAYIDGLKFGDLYNSETREIYGKTPLAFLSLKMRKRAYLPDENGRMGEAVDWNDPRCNWPTKEQIEQRVKSNWNPKTVDKPEAVRVYDFVVLLLLQDGPQIAVISFKSKSFAAGQSLATFISMVKGPSFTAKFTISPAMAENESGKFAKFAVQTAGKPTLEQAQFAAAMYESIKDAKLAEVDPDAPGAEAEVVTPSEQPKKDGNTPF
jgi:hypothetical protein